ncbi:MAG: ABC transporter permease [Flavobacteriales bacterium]
MFADLKSSGELAWRLARRDISALYRQSFLGYLWAFIMPLATTMAWVFLNASGIVRVAETGIPYPVYVLTGTMIWQMFVEALQAPLQQVTMAKTMLTKLKFPRESLILSGMFKWLFNVVIKLIIIVPVLVYFGIEVGSHQFLVPVAILAILIVGTAIGLLLAPLGLLYTDIGRAIPIAAQFAMYITPVVFAMPEGGLTAKLFHLNFMTPLVLNARAWLTGMESVMVPYFIGVSLGAVLLLFVGWLLYRVTMPVLIERMSS